MVFWGGLSLIYEVSRAEEATVGLKFEDGVDGGDFFVGGDVVVEDFFDN